MAACEVILPFVTIIFPLTETGAYMVRVLSLSFSRFPLIIIRFPSPLVPKFAAFKPYR